MDLDLFGFDSGLDIVIVVEGGAAKSIGLQVLHDEGTKSAVDLTSGELNIYLT